MKLKKIIVPEGNNCKGCKLMEDWKCFKNNKKIVDCWDAENDYIFVEDKGDK